MPGEKNIQIKKKHINELCAHLQEIDEFLSTSPGPNNSFTRFLQNHKIIKSRIEISSDYVTSKNLEKDSHSINSVFFKKSLTKRKVHDVGLPMRSMLKNFLKTLPNTKKDHNDNCDIDLETANALLTLSQCIHTFSQSSYYYLQTAGIHYKKEKSRILVPLMKQISLRSFILGANIEREIKRVTPPEEETILSKFRKKKEAAVEFIKGSMQEASEKISEKFEDIKNVAESVIDELPIPQQDLSKEEVEQQLYGRYRKEMDKAEEQFTLYYEEFLQNHPEDEEIPIESLDAIFGPGGS